MTGGTSHRWRYRPGFLTDRGRARERNEDAFDLYVPDLDTDHPFAWFAVADGMGGHDAGDVASRYVTSALREALLAELEPGEPDPGAFLERLFQRIHRDLVALGGETAAGRGMGSTLTVALVHGDALTVAHVGDSRLYRLRDGRLEPRTEDHSWVAEQRRRGLLTEAEAERHAERNVLTQCLGLGGPLDVFLSRGRVRHGDRYLLASDGLYNEVDADTIHRVLAEEGDPQRAARRLVELANAAGGSDNVTTMVFDVLEKTPGDTVAEPVASEAAPAAGGPSKWLIALGALVVAGGLAMGARGLLVPASPTPVPADTVAAADSAPAPRDSTIAIPDDANRGGTP